MIIQNNSIKVILVHPTPVINALSALTSTDNEFKRVLTSERNGYVMFFSANNFEHNTTVGPYS